MTDTPRREFLQHVIAGGAVVSTAGLLSACVSATSVRASGPASPGAGGSAVASATGAARSSGGGAPEWDMSWQGKLGKYKTVFDSPDIYSGAILSYVESATVGYQQAMHIRDGEFTPVLALRHLAAVMALNDGMWELLGLGESRSVKDPSSGEPARRNPFIRYTKDDKFSSIDANNGLDTLMARGAIVLVCNNGLRGAARQLKAKQPSLSSEQALAEIRRNVLPGAYVMPNGIFATAAAQDAGCNYIRVLV